MGELKKLKSFDNKKRSMKVRKKHVEDVLASVELDEILTQTCMRWWLYFRKNRKSLEDLGTYLLMSDDIESEREIKIVSIVMKDIDSMPLEGIRLL